MRITKQTGDDTSDYYNSIKFYQRQAKCRTRARVYSLVDLIYTLPRFLILLAIVGFELRNELRRLQQVQLSSADSSTDQVTIHLWSPTSLVRLVPAFLVIFLQLLASILLFCAVNSASSSRPKRALLRTWILINLLTSPFTVYKTVTHSLLFTLEILLKLVGFLLIYDLIVFTPPSPSRGSCCSCCCGGRKEDSGEIEGEETLLELPSSIGSWFGKSMCTCIDECC